MIKLRHALQHIFESTRILAAVLLLAACALASPSNAQDRLATLVGDGSVLLQSPQGDVLVSINPQAALVPASLLKIPLAQVALEVLGEGFRFETRFYRNDDGDLLIRGMGDPFLVSEEISIIAEALAKGGLQGIRRMVLDDSAFAAELDLPVERGTDQPYGARNSALAVNFNTVNLAWSPAGELISAEAQTPLTALAQELGEGLSPGAAQRINLGDDPETGLRQVQQLFLHFLEQSDIAVTDRGFHRANVTDEWTLLYSHRSSRSLQDNIDGALRYSNNFIANQLFLALGTKNAGYPVTVEAARGTLQYTLGELYGEGFGRDPQSLFMLEGSGLSRTQRISANGMMHILEVFAPHADLLPESDGVLRKSGTLTGVYNFAGYIRAPQGLYPFVILTNQAVNNRDEILRVLQRKL